MKNNNITYDIHEWILDFHQYGRKDSPLTSRALNLLSESLIIIEELQKFKEKAIQELITKQENETRKN